MANGFDRVAIHSDGQQIVSLSALSMMAVPAATGIARQAAQVGQQLGSSFLSVLNQLATPAEETNVSAPSDESDEVEKSESDAWCQKLCGWLREKNISGDLELKFGLDSLDQPHVSVQGGQAEAVEQALANDPTWLQEFRELALDRLAETDSIVASQHHLNSPGPLQLTVRASDSQLESDWH